MKESKRTTTCNRPRPQRPPDVDVGDDDSDRLPSKGSLSATLRIVERKASTSRTSLCSVSCAEERVADPFTAADHRKTQTRIVDSAKLLRFFKFYQPPFANPPQRIQILPPFPNPKHKSPQRPECKDPRKSKSKDTNE